MDDKEKDLDLEDDDEVAADAEDLETEDVAATDDADEEEEVKETE